jgi:bacterioferritin
MGPTTEPPEPVALERIIDRILFLEGVPNMQRLGAVTIGESVPEQLQIQLEGEREALKVLADGIKVSLEEGDDASREFFASSLLEEGAARRLVRDRTLSDRPVGEANYLAHQIHD